MDLLQNIHCLARFLTIPAYHPSSLHSNPLSETDLSPNTALYYNFDSVEHSGIIIHAIALGVRQWIFCSEFKFSKVFRFPLLLPPRKSLHR